MLDAAFQQRCEGLHRRAQRAWGRQFLGRRRRLRVAGGTEATGISDYTSGDDLRYVDWNRCARHDELVTRQFMGTEDHTVYFLLDSSSSMGIGGAAKFELARQLTAALGYLALANHDRVWAAAFADGMTAEFPAGRSRNARGRKAIPALFHFLQEQSPTGGATRLEKTVKQFTARHVRRGLVVLLSDMFDDDRFEVALDSLRLQGYEPLLVHVLDPGEAAPQIRGKVALQPVEGGGRRSAFIDAEDRTHYAEAFDEQCRRVRGYFHRYGLGVAPVFAGDSLTRCLERIVLGSARRRHTRAGVR